MRLPEKLIWPAVRIVPAVADPSGIALGQSRFGGLPDVPAAFDWPRWHERPLAFLAQINLADVAGFECSVKLPRAGWLLFFYDPEQEAWGFDPADRGCSHVAYVDATATLVRRPLPDDMPDGGRFSVAALTFAQSQTKPDLYSPWVEALNLNEQQEKALFEELDAHAGDLDPTIHQIGGHPMPVQNAMELECQLASNGVRPGAPMGHEPEPTESLKAGKFDWRCVLQLDSDDDIGWMWGDVGRIYFWMTENDIAERRFGNAWLIFQCC